MTNRFHLLAAPFFLSGLAALTYQVAWQRLLFATFGVDIESITIIVATFMLGLGIGALFGGQLADRYPTCIIYFFAAAEAMIGLFGFASPHLITAVGNVTIHSSLPIIALANFLLLLLPTTLMGATLPMLVAFLVKGYGNVGVSIGNLYFINTLGAALGAFTVGYVWFYYFEINTIIYVASLINFFVSAIVLYFFWGK